MMTLKQFRVASSYRTAIQFEIVTISMLTHTYNVSFSITMC